MWKKKTKGEAKFVITEEYKQAVWDILNYDLGKTDYGAEVTVHDSYGGSLDFKFTLPGGVYIVLATTPEFLGSHTPMQTAANLFTRFLKEVQQHPAQVGDLHLTPEGKIEVWDGNKWLAQITNGTVTPQAPPYAAMCEQIQSHLLTNGVPVEKVSLDKDKELGCYFVRMRFYYQGEPTTITLQLTDEFVLDLKAEHLLDTLFFDLLDAYKAFLKDHSPLKITHNAMLQGQNSAITPAMLKTMFDKGKPSLVIPQLPVGYTSKPLSCSLEDPDPAEDDEDDEAVTFTPDFDLPQQEQSILPLSIDNEDLDKLEAVDEAINLGFAALKLPNMDALNKSVHQTTHGGPPGGKFGFLAGLAKQGPTLTNLANVSNPSYNKDVGSPTSQSTEGKMALKIKHKGMDNYTALQNAFGVPGNLLAALKDNGITVEFGGSEIQFRHGDVVVADLDMMAGTLSAAQAGTLKPAEKKVISEIVTKAVKKAIKSVEGKVKILYDVPEDFGGQFSKAKTEADAQPAPVTAAPVDTSVLAMDPVLLKNATKLYQPVRASSPTSVYHVVALNQDLRIAARLLKGNLSLRAEGNILKYQQQLINAGFEPDHFPEYCSVHLAVGTNPVMAARTLGSFIGGLTAQGIPFETPVPMLTVFASHGK